LHHQHSHCDRFKTAVERLLQPITEKAHGFMWKIEEIVVLMDEWTAKNNASEETG
jgi:hypothetical protein